MEHTVFTPALEGMKDVKSEQGEMLTKPFLEVCKQILPVIDKFGAALTLMKTDIDGNITRLESKYNTNPTEFNVLYSMVKAEIEAKTAKGSSSCTNGLLWLTRAMDFLMELFRNLVAHPDWAMSQVCTDAYSKTLKKWHGWLASSSFTVAMKLAPDRKKFMDVLGGSGDINADIEKFCATFSPFLEENHKFLVKDILSPKDQDIGRAFIRDVRHSSIHTQSPLQLFDIVGPYHHWFQDDNQRLEPGPSKIVETSTRGFFLPCVPNNCNCGNS